jgi:hypothetical protein
MSIVLVIIGLIVGGVLVGQDLIYTAKLRQTAGELTQFDSAFNTFKLEYGYLPGAMPNATQYWSQATNEPDNGQISAFGNFAAWQELSLAELISSNNNGLYDGSHPTMPGINVPASAFKGKLGYFVEYVSTPYLSPNNYLHYIYGDGSAWGSGVNTFAPSDIAAIDSKIDDGLPLTGKLIGDQTYWPCVTVATNQYSTQNSDITCSAFYQLSE